MNAPVRVHPIMRIPPPLLFVATFFAGLGLQFLLPLSLRSYNFVYIVNFIGKGLAGAGVLLALSCVGMFLFSRTTLIPFANAACLVRHGPYRFSRNPMYLSLVLVYLGAVGIMVQIWPLILLPVPIAIMHMIVIPYEEARMQILFGEAFTRYCEAVRRWI